jgi:putative hydrolase of the HAD superfamily
MPSRSAREGLEFVFFDVGSTLVEQTLDPVRLVEGALRTTRSGRDAPAAAMAEALRAMDTVYRADLDACDTLEAEAAFWRRVAWAGLDALRADGGDPASGEVEAAAAVLTDYNRTFAVRPGMRELLAAVRQAELRVGIISNWPPSLPRLLQSLDLGPFEVLACSGVLQVTKPDPAIFRWALDQAAVPAARAAHIGDDRERDYLPARALGMHAIWLAPGTTAADVGRALGLAGF